MKYSNKWLKLLLYRAVIENYYLTNLFVIQKSRDLDVTDPGIWD